ncbi:MAG: putative cytosolic protein [Herbaspirillum sp.]|nr:putative cytosolic protein [Herbaspirillum sp.]
MILIASPVRGLRPVRAARLPTENVPKPTNVTVPFFFNVFFTAPISASNARAEAAFEISASVAMCSINSVLFTYAPLKIDRHESGRHMLPRHSASSFYSLHLPESNAEKLQGVLNKGQSTVSSALQPDSTIKFHLPDDRLASACTGIECIKKNAPKSVFYVQIRIWNKGEFRLRGFSASPCWDRQALSALQPQVRSPLRLRSVRPAPFPAPLPAPCRSSVPE